MADERAAILHGAPTLRVRTQTITFPGLLSDQEQQTGTTTTDTDRDADQETTMRERFRAKTNLVGGGTTIRKGAEFDPRSIGLGGAALERQIELGNVERIAKRNRARLAQPAEAQDVSHAVPDATAATRTDAPAPVGSTGGRVYYKDTGNEQSIGHYGAPPEAYDADQEGQRDDKPEPPSAA